MNADLKEATIREAILDVVAYFAVFKVPVSNERLISLIPVRANHLAIQAVAHDLVAEGELQMAGDGYGLSSVSYGGIEAMRMRQDLLMSKARRVGRLVGVLPFVKAVCVVNSVAIGNVRDDSGIDLVIMTTPGRIFVTKGLLWKLFTWLRLIETRDEKAGKYSLRLFMTTRGVMFEKDIMYENVPDLVFRLMTITPVYGAQRWYEILRASTYLKAAVPNYIWPTGNRTIDRSGWKWLDRLDDRGYRIHLKHTSRQQKHLKPEAFVRVRPDIINLHAVDRTREIAEQWHKLRGTWVAPDTGLKPLRAQKPKKPRSRKA